MRLLKKMKLIKSPYMIFASLLAVAALSSFAVLLFITLGGKKAEKKKRAADSGVLADWLGKRVANAEHAVDFRGGGEERHPDSVRRRPAETGKPAAGNPLIHRLSG